VDHCGEVRVHSLAIRLVVPVGFQAAFRSGLVTTVRLERIADEVRLAA
jgi:hypothetical protein